MTDDERLDALEKCYTSILHDVMRERGLRDFALPARITPLQPEAVLCGPAFTVEGRLDPDASAHDTLLAWTGLLSQAKPGHVWVSQPHNQKVAQMGELSAETLLRKKVRGCVVDGALRDANAIMKLGFICWRTFHTPCDIVGTWLPTGADVEIKIGDVQVCPGDWMHGDRDGMVRIPAGDIDEVIAAASVAMQTENKVRTAIIAGVDPQEAYRKYGKF